MPKLIFGRPSEGIIRYKINFDFEQLQNVLTRIGGPCKWSLKSEWATFTKTYFETL